jgi:hypothetical protein
VYLEARAALSKILQAEVDLGMVWASTAVVNPWYTHLSDQTQFLLVELLHLPLFLLGEAF